MGDDYKRFSQNRELFPRYHLHDSNRLICGHLNRLKFPTDIDTYLKNRQQGKSAISSLARANRCFCRRQDIPKNHGKQRLNQIQQAFEDTKILIQVLQKIEIILPKQKKQ